ncbi:MAG: GspH/FimT family pseudopilin [Magnetococcales bacterium]|nr:GspH/FimT family pseudopilin [Magnetococcales bacterium]
MAKPGSLLRRSNHLDTEGFTLLELVLVMVVLGLLAFSAIPLFPDGVDRVAEARRLAGEIRLAQSHAMNRGERYTILSTGDSSYEIRDSSNNPVAGSTTTLKRGSLSTFTIEFDSFGSPTAGATTITVTDNGTTQVGVAADTGYVSVP